MTNEIIERKEYELSLLKEEVKGLKRREKLINKLGFSEQVPKEIFSQGVEKLDDYIIGLCLDGKLDHMKYIAYFSEKNGFQLPTFSEFFWGY
jgi:hypothetical protein